MEEITSGVFTFTGLRVGRVYLISEGDGLTLIDASIPPSGSLILNQLQAVGHPLQNLKRIVITHAHPDHVGAIPELQRATGAELIVPTDEQAAFEGKIPIPSAPGLLKPPKTILKDMKADRLLEDGEIIAEALGGLHAISTPGHAPGHMAYWQPERRILFCGDVIFHMRNMRLPYNFLTVDKAQNIQSIRKLVPLKPEIICFGHGRPIVTNAAERLAQFAEKVGAH
ncbi:MAG: MBL fold metallo-hydrolase [Chloroflexota bacterium]